MVSGQIIQNTLDGISGIMKVDAAVFDIYGKQLAATLGAKRTVNIDTAAFLREQTEEYLTGECRMCRVQNEQETEYIALVKGEDENARQTLCLIKMQLEALLTAYRDKNDRDNFYKNLLLDNLLLIDIYSRARKLHIDLNQRRAVVMVEIKDKDSQAFDVVKGMFAGKNGDHVTTVDENNIIVIHELREENAAQELTGLCRSILRQISESGMKARTAYGTTVQEIKELSRSYKEAKLALDVGRIFYEGKEVAAYNNLGIGRLIYQLPLSFCRMFIDEIFDNRFPDEFDEETLTTINKFFENNLNVSETSRQLFIHRNTLVYRLDKLLKNTGLDLRVFDDAITFKIALMVVKYMDYMDKMEY